MLFAVTLFAALCSAQIYDTTFDNVTWDDAGWKLSTSVLDQGHYQSRISLANGYLGINVAAAGPFFEVDTPVDGDIINGWPLFDRRQTFATVAGFYATEADTNGTNFPWLLQYGGESVIAGIPHWSGLLVESGGYVLNASVPSDQITNFNSTLDLKQGLKSWNYTWTPPGGPSLNISYQMLVHKLYINQAAVQLSITAEESTNVTVIDVFNGDCAVRSDFKNSGYEQKAAQIWSAVSPHWVGNVTAYIYSTLTGDKSVDMSSRVRYKDSAYIGGNSSSIAQSVQVSLRGETTSVITKFIGAASTDAFADPQGTALNASQTAAAMGFSKLLEANAAEWAELMSSDSVDSYVDPQSGMLPDDVNLVTLQIIAVTNPWYLMQNTISANAIKAASNNTKLDIWSISVGGLGSSSYAGWIFWDAEVWMAPGLVVQNPQAAKQIANYRLQLFPRAQANVNESYQGSTNKTTFTPGGAVFPWVSGRYGNCTAAGPCFDYEYHLNGDIGLELYNWYVATGDSETFKNDFFPIYDAVAHFYSQLLFYNSSSDKYELLNATDPDEYANHVDNAAYTQALIQTHLTTANELRARFSMEPNATWADQISKIDVPVDKQADIILEYQEMNGTISVKQADVVLVDDFLDYPNPYSLSDLDYYAGKQSLNGPGMTYGVYSIVANEISPSGCSSYTYDLYGSLPYIRAPWFQYSEQLVDNYQANGGTHPAFPFLTGMGGAHRVAIFGYLGLRLFVDSLNLDPSLPPQITNLKYRMFYWQGHPISAYSNATHTSISRVGQPLANANSTYTNGDIPVTIGLAMNETFQLPPNGTLVLSNRMIGQNKTIAGNIAQCRPASSNQGYLPGQLPLSAVDGAISTKWEPLEANTTSELVVELEEPYVPISGFHFDWAQTPPTSYYIAFSNESFTSSDAKYVNVTSSDNITVSSPFNIADVAAIVPYTSNTTDITLDSPVWSGRYARLLIYGAQTDDFLNFGNGTGATVAEWAIIQADGGHATVKTKREPRQPYLNVREQPWPYVAGFGGPGRI
ncbi:uncharacterized protein PV09_01192 [Verruconis gallopava]|uniref:alpha,alpha-trehalase n=1 Tax=Verruconis gallopava TaxID=253628 RepID=A0A0D1Z5M0_9PEZI|nr:uncharacterized protein PV09_01192 [Verruconis gallopava]KIW08272.1 hypothetical protein PV09_01192 [Verruconis gallopava]